MTIKRAEGWLFKLSIEVENAALTELEVLRAELQPTRQALLEHRIYGQIRGLSGLRLFMEHHVFAVWDFMSILKALQQRLCCTEVPWLPAGEPLACRLINEIVLSEESDEDGQGGYASHFELYRACMQQCGARTTAIDGLLAALRRGQPVAAALRAHLSAPAHAFVSRTFECIDTRDTCVLAAAFTFGREDLLPDIFRRIVVETHAEFPGQLERFHYYLNRHVHLDDDKHGPMAETLVSLLCGRDPALWQKATLSALRALHARLQLWDDVASLFDEFPLEQLHQE